MAFSKNPVSFWIWLIPDEKTNKLIYKIRSNKVLKKLQNKFPPHLTLCKVDKLMPENFLLDPSNIDFRQLNGLRWKINVNENNYFNSVTLIPIDNNFKKMLSSFCLKNKIILKKEIDPHISISYGLAKAPILKKLRQEIEIKFCSIGYAFVDEEKEIWELI